MRTLIALCLAPLSVLALAAPASATTLDPPHPTPFGPQRPYEPDVAGPLNIQEGTVAVTPDGGGPDGIKVTFDARRYTATGEKPAAPRQFVFLFDSTIRLHTWEFPTCARDMIEQGGFAACPPGSQVGSGHAQFHGGGSADIVVFNTSYDNGLRGVLITIPAAGAIFDNTLEPVTGHYRSDYRWGLDEIQPPDATPPQDRPSTSAFAVTFGATWNGHSFLTSDAEPSTTLDLGVWSHYVTGQTTLNEGQAIRP
jgi:hypothetical protein